MTCSVTHQNGSGSAAIVGRLVVGTGVDRVDRVDRLSHRHQRMPDRDHVPDRCVQRGDPARERAGYLHRGLRGLHLDHDVVDRDIVALRHPPGQDFRLGQPLAEVGQ
jgi:hypothetical protein